MKFSELTEHLNGQVGNIYLVTGQDDFLMDKTISNFKKKLITCFEDLNFEVFDDENFDMQAIINACNGVPFASEKKLIVVKNFSKLIKDDEKKLTDYAKNPNPTTCLILISNEKSLQSLNNATIIDCQTLSNDSLSKLIASLCKKQEKSITVKAANLLMEKCENDSMKISNEIIKLSSYETGDTINEEDVKEVVTDSFDLDIFKLTNALANKNGTLALEVLTNLLSAKTEPFAIFASISSNFRRMFLTSLSGDLTNEQIAERLGVKPYAITKAKENAKKFSVKKLKKINELSEECDFLSKNGNLSQLNALYYFLFSILAI